MSNVTLNHPNTLQNTNASSKKTEEMQATSPSNIRGVDVNRKIPSSKEDKASDTPIETRKSISLMRLDLTETLDPNSFCKTDQNQGQRAEDINILNSHINDINHEPMTDFLNKLDDTQIKDYLNNSSNPLMIAITKGHAKIVNLFLGLGADHSKFQYSRNSRQYRPIHAAIANSEILKSLLTCEGIDINQPVKNSDGRDTELTALFFAANSSNHESIELLLQHNADHNIETPDQDLLLNYVIFAKQDLRSLEILIKFGFNIDDIIFNDLQIKDSLLHKITKQYEYINTNANNKTFNEIIQEKNFLENAACLLIDSGVTKNDRFTADSSIACFAIRNNMPKVVEKLFNDTGSKALFYQPQYLQEAVQSHYPNLNTIKILLGLGAQVTDETLAMAKAQGHPEIIKLIESIATKYNPLQD